MVKIDNRKLFAELLSQILAKADCHAVPVYNSVVSIAAGVKPHLDQGASLSVRKGWRRGVANPMGTVLKLETHRGATTIAFDHHRVKIEVRGWQGTSIIDDASHTPAQVAAIMSAL